MGRVKAALAIGLALIAGGVAVTLTQAPPSLARRNTDEDQILGSMRRKAQTCQPDEVLPRGTSAVRLHIYAEYGPRVELRALEGGRIVAQGEQRAGWTGGAVTVPVSPLTTRRSAVKLCFTLFLNGDETLSPLGERTSRALAAREGDTTLPGRVTVEYLRPGPSSWWSLLLPVARRMGLGRAAAGTWNVVAVIALMAGALLICSRLVVRELR
jgi:hypothetical protein